jgi:molybdopterin-guanine dinucleotide biosynthesis protein A
MISLVIPAAGSGTRMQQELPKALTRFGNSTFLEWQINKFKHIADEIYVIIASKDLDKFEEFRRIHDLNFKIVLQKEGKGSYFAIQAVIELISSDLTLICWADQIGLSKSLILETVNKIRISKSEGLIPLIFIAKPYVRANLDDESNLLGWEYRREGAEPDNGYSDLGFFAFKTDSLKLSMRTITDYSKFESALTHEFNFLDFLPHFASTHNLGFLHTTDLINSKAVNTKDELEGAKFSVTPKVFEITYSIIIPSFNEGPRLLKLLTQLNSLSSSQLGSYSFAFEIIVVDDGSTDDTGDILKQFSFKNVYQPNSGKGSAVKLGKSIAKGDYIIVLDADGEYLVSDLIPLMSFSELHPTSVVYGSRYIKKNSKKVTFLPLKGQSVLNLYFNHFLTFIILTRFKVLITDSLTGYKIYHKTIYDSVNPVTKGFETDHELSKKIIELGVKIIEFPISYLPRSKKEGKKISFRDALKAVKLWLT